MRAMVLPQFGGPGLFELREIEKPAPGVGEILVRVMVSGTNPVDAKVRASGHWAKLQLPAVIGYDASGIVDALGAGVTDIQVGDEVYYTPEIAGNSRGTYAEFNAVAASIAARKPSTLSFEEAAAIPLAGGTAWEAIVRRLQIHPGETILIQGAAGGVGTFAVQFAKASGARVIASASPKHHEKLRELGADLVLDYRDQGTVVKSVLDETGGQGADAAFDIYGGDLIARCLPALRPFGRIACILPPQGDLSLLYMHNITLYGVFLTRERKRLDDMRPVFERRQARPVIDQVLPLEDVAKAHERLDSAHGFGKIVLRVAPR